MPEPFIGDVYTLATVALFLSLGGMLALVLWAMRER